MANTSSIPGDYNKLRTEYLVIKKQLERVYKSNYENSKEIRRLKALESEHHEEKKKIEQHKQEASLLKNNIQKLECELGKKSETIQNLNEELKTYRTGHNRRELLENIECLEKENLMLFEIIEELNSEESTHLENTLVLYKEEVTNMKKIVSEAQRSNEKLNDDVLKLRCELESVKTKDDRRLEKYITKFRSVYIQMKEEYGREHQEDHRILVNAFIDRLQNLEFLVDKYKCELQARTEITDNAQSDTFLDILKYKENEVEEFRKRLSKKSLNTYLMAKSLREAYEEKRKWREEAAFKDHLLQLKTEMALNNV